MLLKPDKKKMAIHILEMVKGKPSEDKKVDSFDSENPMEEVISDSTDDNQDSSFGKNAAAEDLIAAISSGKAKKVVAAFEALLEFCKDEEDTESQDSEESEEY